MLKHRNMHPIDQMVRILLGIALIYIGFFNREVVTDPLLGILLGGFGLINLVSGLIATCPIYAIAGISTLRKATHSQ
jgi:cyanate permease